MAGEVLYTGGKNTKKRYSQVISQGGVYSGVICRLRLSSSWRIYEKQMIS